MVGFQINIKKWLSDYSSAVSWEVILKTEAVSTDLVANQNKQKCAENENNNSYMADTK